MKRILIILLLATACRQAYSQKVDSIFFHLYTDSLKKGTHNYINVDGKLANGRWMPMTDRDIQFSASACTFMGNELVIPEGFAEKKITIKAVLKADPSIWIEQSIWIKQLPDPDLPGPGNSSPQKTKRRRGLQ